MAARSPSRATARAAASRPRSRRPRTSVVGSLPPRAAADSRATCSCASPSWAKGSRRRAGGSTIDELVPEGVSPEVVEELLEQLADARLVTLGEGTAEVAHEVLIREWPTLRRLARGGPRGIRLHRQLGDAARLWEAGGREPSDLYRGARLGAAADWARPIETT